MNKLNQKLKFLKTKSIVFFAFFYLIPSFFIYADSHIAPTPPPPGGSTIVNPIGYSSIDDLLTAILNFVVQLGTPVVTIAIIYVGFKFVAARGNSQKIEEAKSNLWYVLIGSAIILGAFVLRAVITGTVSQIKSGAAL
jgi:hypothetical protein